MEYVLQSKNLIKKYGEFKALNNLNIHIPKGSIYGLIGKNGAGKTTLIRMICGLQKITDGEIILDENIKLGAIIEHPAIYEELSARDNLMIMFKLVGNSKYEDIDNLLKLVNLDVDDSKKVEHYSLGMKQRLGIAISLINHPDFLLLDEPINGLDPEGIIEIRELLLKLSKEKKITILISSHYLDELSKIATHYGFMEKGSIIKEISKKDLEKSLLKKVHLCVNDIKKVIPILKKLKINYEILDDKNINLLGDIDIQEILSTLKDKSIKVLKIEQIDETLENYFINLLGGKND